MQKPFINILKTIAALLLVLAYFPGCSRKEPPMPAELILYNWPDYMPQPVLDAFEKEYGTKVIVQTYESQDVAWRNIKNRTVTYDVAVIESDLLPSLINANELMEIDYRNIPNFANISADFRDLTYDPGNRHSVPYNWGTSGLLVRSDLVDEPITKWADLWDPRYAGRIGIRNEPTEIISIALRSLGFPLNSEDPAQLQAAFDRFLELRKSVRFYPADLEPSIQALDSGQIVILQGWNGDALVARKKNPLIKYVLPAEGTMLWSDNFVISAYSSKKYAAECFINFLLRPEISAQIVETYEYPSANEAITPFIDPAILNDPIIYPPRDYLRSNEFYSPLSENGQRLYDAIWQQFLEAAPK